MPYFFFQAEDGIRDLTVTGVQTCALPISKAQAELIEDMLDVSRIITGRLRLELQPVRLSEAVEAALDSVRPTAEAKGVRLECNVGPDPGVIAGDEHRLQQIVWNLLSNAVKFTPPGGVVRVQLEYTGAEAKVT